MQSESLHRKRNSDAERQMFAYWLTAGAMCAAVVAAGLIIRRKLSEKLNIFFRIVSLVLAAALFVRYMSGDDNLSNVQNLQVGYGFSSKALVVLALAQVWLAYAAEMLVILASFFKNKTIPSLVGLFGSFVFVLNFVLLNNHVVAIAGEEALQTFSLRALLLSVETGIGLGYSALYCVCYGKEILPKGKAWGSFALCVCAMIAASLPSYTFQYLGNTNAYTMEVTSLNFYHRMMLYPMVIIPVVMYLLLRNKPEQTRYFALMYYAWAGLLNFSYFHRFADFVGSGRITALPLHLCNTAMYITPLCLTFKWKKLFYFTYFINVLGAFWALLIPNYGETGIFAWNLWQFYQNHYQAFFMPLLIVGLGIFPRPRWKEFSYSMVSFAVYFVLMLVINAWFTNYNSDVDYFFLNSGFIAEKLGVWAENLRDVVVEFDLGDLHFRFYPIYQVLFLAVYYAMSFGIWFIYELAYNVICGWQDIGSRFGKIKADRLALEVKLNGRSIEEPIYMENTNKLVLSHFTKRYAHSDVYAVKDANLEVCGGEIFGFLGPNGAGKSTIIKSIVGIQTITDGAISVCGYDVATQSVQAKKQIGFVPDHYALYERLTAREYINYIADLYEVSQEDRDERLNNFIKLFEFEAAIDNPIKTYSHGMKQKVTIMSALIHDPKVWILDEPLTGLDPNSIFQVKECMKQHAQKGNIVFFSSHIIDVVERICDKIAIIRKGQIQCVRDVREMEENGESLEQFYLQTINGGEIKPIAVDEEVRAKDKPEKPVRQKKRKNG